MVELRRLMRECGLDDTPIFMAGGVWLYVKHTRADDRVGDLGLWALVVFLVVVYFANLLGPPPPSVPAVAWSAQAVWLIVAWGYWIDRNRLTSNTSGSRSKKLKYKGRRL